MLNNKEFLLHVLNEVDTFIFIIDEFRRVVETNNNTFSYLGYNHHELLEKPFLSLVIEDDKENTEKVLKDMFNEDHKGAQEFFIQTKDGDTKLISCKYFVYRISNIPSTDDPVYIFPFNQAYPSGESPKVVVTGCMNCEKLAAMCQTVIIEKEIEGYVEKITDREKNNRTRDNDDTRINY